MDFNIKIGQPEKQRSDCLVLPVFEPGKLPELSLRLEKNTTNFLNSILNMGDIEGKVGQTLLLLNPPGLNTDRVLLIGCGKESELNDTTFRDISTRMINALNSTGAKEAACYLNDLNVENRNTSWKIQQAVVAIMSSLYKFEQYKSTSGPKAKNKRELKKLTFILGNKRELDKAELALKTGVTLSNAMNMVKDLANTPPNVCHPEYLAKFAVKLAKQSKHVSSAILDHKDLQSLKMGAILAVGQGSAQPPKLITLEYRGANKNQEPIVLVGKGITFDSGGNSLKPAANMIGMKFDMCGAATVLGAIKFASDMALPLNIVGVIAAAENMPGGTASRPDDIITTMAGITVEILNTDAEGRLVLSDALTYCERFKPKVVIDMATLTGACVVALGNFHSGLYTNYQPLADELLEAGRVTGDKCWQMPLTDDYQKLIDSNVADIANVGGPDAGSVTAACFLSRFTKKYHWAHLDIAGTACKFTGKDRGATGQPLPLIAEYLVRQVKS